MDGDTKEWSGKGEEHCDCQKSILLLYHIFRKLKCTLIILLSNSSDFYFNWIWAERWCMLPLPLVIWILEMETIWSGSSFNLFLLKNTALWDTNESTSCRIRMNFIFSEEIFPNLHPKTLHPSAAVFLYTYFCCCSFLILTMYSCQTELNKPSFVNADAECIMHTRFCIPIE